MLPISAYNNNKNHGKNDFNLLGKIKVKIIVVSFVTLFSLIFAQLVFANNLATDGQKLSEVYSEIEKLEAENTLLKVEIAKSAALTNLSKDAQSEGFKTPSRVINF